jgi:hypothetical protein
MRIGAGALLAVTLAVVTQVSWAGVLRGRFPQQALRLTPADAVAQASLAAALAEIRGSKPAHDLARELALLSIARTPLNPVAVRALALTEPAEPGTARARAARAMEQAQRLSRRDQPSLLWLIQNDLRSGDRRSALRRLDVALRSSSASNRDTLFGLVSTMSADSQIANALAARLAARPRWAAGLLNYMITSGGDPQRTAAFVQKYARMTLPEDRALVRALLERLDALGEYPVAWRVYSGFGLNQRAGQYVQDPGFELANGYLPFAWRLADDPRLSATRLATPGGGKGLVLAVSAESGRSGEVARQLLRLPNGAYELSAAAGRVATSASERPAISVRCLANGSEPLIVLRPAASGAGRQGLRGHFVVDRGCEFQWLAVTLSSGLDADAEAWIDDVKVTTALTVPASARG